MGFNYGLEKRKFDRRWERLSAEYRAAGMDEESIKSMREFDWGAFNADRAYASHTQGMGGPDGAEGADGVSPALLCRHFGAFSVMPQETDGDRRYGWMDEIGSERLSRALRGLSEKDVELLTLYAFDGYSVTEIAAMQGVAQPTVSKKLSRIRKLLKNF